MRYARVAATGSYLPETEIRNEDFKQFPKAALGLIEEKTGVKSRRYAAKGEFTSDIALKAAAACLKRESFKPSSIDAIILCTSSPDSLQPATAARVQHSLGADKAFAFDINAVCSGGVYGLHLADSLIKSGNCKSVLLVGAEIYSRFLNTQDFSTCPYFGDGAGAMLLVVDEKPGVMRTLLGTDGSGSDIITVRAGGTMIPCAEANNPKDRYFQMDGRAVFDFAVSKGTDIVKELLEAEGIRSTDIAFVVAHQANINILRELSSRLDIGMEKFFVNLDKYGNTAAASTLIAFDELFPSLKRGDLVIMVAFGGGLSWGASLISV